MPTTCEVANIQAPDYSIVENLLHSISEGLKRAMDHPLIEAWAIAYGQLADILFKTERANLPTAPTNQRQLVGLEEHLKIARKTVESERSDFFYVELPVDGGALPTCIKRGNIFQCVSLLRNWGQQPRQYTLSTHPQPELFTNFGSREQRQWPIEAAGWVSNTLHQLPETAEDEVSAPTANFF